MKNYYAYYYNIECNYDRFEKLIANDLEEAVTYCTTNKKEGIVNFATFDDFKLLDSQIMVCDNMPEDICIVASNLVLKTKKDFYNFAIEYMKGSTKDVFGVFGEAIQYNKDHPKLIHPDQKDKIEKNKHGLGEGFPKQKGQSFGDSAASKSYADLIEKVRKYTGAYPENDVFGLMGSIMQNLQQCIQIESEHKDYLQDLAVKTVLELPMFKPLKDAYDNGQITIDAELTHNMVIAPNNETGDDEDLQPFQEEIKNVNDQLFDALHDIDGNVLKRRFANLFTQGAASTNFELFQLVKTELDKIDPQLVNKYGLSISTMRLTYWMLPDMGQEGMPSAGYEQLEYEEGGKKKITAKGMIFPILIHELVKGAMEVVGDFSMTDNPNARKEIFNKADTVKQETIGLLIGDQLWKKFTELFSQEEQQYVMYVYNKILSLPTEQEADSVEQTFVKAIKTIIENGTDAKALIAKMVKEVKQEIDKYNSEQ